MSGIFKPLPGAQLRRDHPLALGFSACWLLNENSGTNVHDYSGQGNTGTLTGFADPSTSTSGWGPGAHGGALLFDGTAGIVTVTDNASLRPSTLTVAATVKVTDDLSTDRHIANNRDASVATKTWNWGLYIGTDGKFHFIHGLNSWAWSDTASDAVLTAGSVVHVAAVKRTGAVASLYINGQPATATGGSASAINYRAGKDLTIGCYNIAGYEGPLYDKGTVENLSIYNRALSAEEIAYLSAFPYCMFDPPAYPEWLQRIISSATAKVPPPDGKGRKRTIYKPTGLVERKPAKATRKETPAPVEAELETVDRADELAEEPIPVERPIEIMTMAEIEREIAVLLHRKLRSEEEELLLLMLMAATA